MNGGECRKGAAVFVEPYRSEAYLLYTLTGDEERGWYTWYVDWRFFKKEYGMVRLENVLFRTLLLDDIKLEDGKIYAEFWTCSLARQSVPIETRISNK